MKKASRFFLVLAKIIIVACDCLFILVTFLPYATIKRIGDFLSPDKNFKSLTPALVGLLRTPSLAFGILFFLMGVFVYFWSFKARDLIETFLGFLYKFYIRFIKDYRTLFQDIWQARAGRLETLALAVIVVFSAATRLMVINHPIEYDEAYTFTEFARYPFRYIVSTYYVPNNQVLNTILMRFSYLLFGDQLWQLRLPTFLVSLLIVVSAFLLGRSFYNGKVGIAAAVLVAFTPVMVLRSVSARGYIIVTLMTLVGFLAADYVIRQKNIFAWFFLIITCTIGFYAIPVMLYPCGLVFVWLFLTGLTKGTSKEYSSFVDWLKYLICAGFSILILTLILYSPILLTNNLRQIYVNNRVLQPASLANFIANLPATFHGLMMEWQTGISLPIVLVLLAGLFLSFLFKDSKYRISLQLVFIIYIIIMALIERPYPITRIWLWMIPLLAIWCSAGIVGVLQWITQRWPIRTIFPVILAILLLGFAGNGMYQSYSMRLHSQSGDDPVAQKVTLFLKPLLTKDDYVAVSACSDARYWYYFHYYGIPEIVIRNHDRFFTKVYIIVYTQANPSCGNEEMLNVFSESGPEATFFDLNTVRTVKQIDYATIYELDPILGRVQKAYPNH